MVGVRFQVRVRFKGWLRVGNGLSFELRLLNFYIKNQSIKKYLGLKNFNLTQYFEISLNGGKCTEDCGPVCECEPGFVGRRCENSDCNGNFCLNGGTCMLLNTSEKICTVRKAVVFKI